MFIGKLRKDDFSTFASSWNCELTGLSRIDENTIVITLSNGGQCKQPSYTLTDFFVKSNNKSYQNYEESMQKSWRDFMGEIFGKEYKRALKKALNKTLAPEK